MRVSLSLILSFHGKKRSPKSTRRRRGDDFVAPEITLDLMIEILTRLPAKSLMRFKRVSKLWFSLIRSRYFTNLYFKVAPPRLYVSRPEHLACDSMEVCHKPGRSMLVSLSLSSSNNADSFNEEFTMPGIGGHSMVVLRGLILYKVCRKACIHNPTTRQSLTLPSVKSNIFAQEGFEKNVDVDDVSEISKFVGFIEYGGKPAILDHSDLIRTTYITDLEEYGSMDLWVLEDGGKWSKKSLVLQPCQMHLVYENRELVVEGTTRNGEVILAPFMFDDYVLYYDLQKNDLRKVEFRIITQYGFTISYYKFFTLMDKCESIMHLET